MATDIKQVWFAGVHCDVGGGYLESESGLSKIALKWMVNEAKSFGLIIDPKAEATIIPERGTNKYAAPNPAAQQHESLRGWWWLAELLPKRFRDPADNFTTRWIIPAGRYRHVDEKSLIHSSVFERQRRVTTYQPGNLPTDLTEIL